MHEVSPTQDTYLAHGNSKVEVRERSRHKNNSKRVVRNLDEMYVATKRRKVPNKT